jgi:hypothetical protein
MVAGPKLDWLSATSEPGSPVRECDSVARAALEHLGKNYRITRELIDGFIDCSTIVSQAHWIGGGVRVPFIAESQRKAVNGTRVDSLAEMLPGDVLVAYPSTHAAPGGRHNHVALFLGTDPDGQAWAIEAREGSVASVIPLECAHSDGGIRRFCPNPKMAFHPGAWSMLARRVPKLGRLGARLTSQYTERGQRHAGTDIYAPHGSTVCSPVSGWVEALYSYSGVPSGLSILSMDQRVLVVLKPVAVYHHITEGAEVVTGQSIGNLVEPVSVGGCNRIPRWRDQAFLHLEIWSTESLGGPPALDVPPSMLTRGLGAKAKFLACNSLYAIKLGKLRSPIDSAGL